MALARFRAAIECLVGEAVQFTKLSTRHRNDASVASVADGTAVDTAPGAIAKQPVAGGVESREGRRLEVIDASSVEEAMRQVLSHMAGDDAAAAAMLSSEA